MRDGGRLTIKAYCSAAMVVIEITNDGLGVPEDIEIFELFKTTNPGGTGLGLPVVQRVISAHRGTIDYRSDRGRTTFTISLPVSNESLCK